MLKSFLKSFADAKSQYEKRPRGRRPRRPTGLICRVGDMNCAVLKLQKAAWTNDDLSKIGNQTGIFFSIWITQAAADQGRIDYNIHAMSVRKLKRYKLTGNALADRFREEFASVRPHWPNVSTAFGCQTLMQGSYPLRARFVARDALALMRRFETELAPIIDDLLQQRAKPVSQGRGAELMDLP
jgi:hypothetical protein